MNKKHIISALSILQRLRVGGEPDAQWTRQTRADLLARVRTNAGLERAPTRRVLDGARAIRAFLPIFDAPALAFRPVLASILSIAVVMGGSVSAVSAAINSLPGDALYGVKLASEKVQVAAAGSERTKAELSVAFVGRRMDEVKKIVDSDDPNSAARVDVAVQKMKENLGVVQERLTSVQENAPESAVSIAKLIDDKSSEYTAVLKKTAEQLPPAEQQHMKEARALVNDLSVQAVVLLVQAHENGDTDISAEEVTNKVERRIESLTNDAARVAVRATSTEIAAIPYGRETANQALNALDVAKTLLNQNQFTPALTKVIEGQELVSAAEKIINATSGTAASTALSTSSSTTGATLGGGTGSVGITPLPEDPDAATPPPSTSEPVTGVTTSTSPSSGGELGN